MFVREVDDPGVLPYLIARHLKRSSWQEQQALLETSQSCERLEKILAYLQAPK